MEEKNIASQTPITTRIKSIDFVDLKLSVISEEQRKSLDINRFIYEFAINIKVNPSSKELLVSNTTKIFSDESQKIPLGEIESVGTFQLLNYDEVVSTNNGLPNSIISLFAAVLVSTSRGFLLLKSKNTFLEGAIIPIVDASKFLIAHPNIAK